MRRRNRQRKQVTSVNDPLIKALKKMSRRPPRTWGDAAGIVAGLFFDNMLQGMQQRLQQPSRQIRYELSDSSRRSFTRAVRVPQASGIEAEYIPPRK